MEGWTYRAGFPLVSVAFAGPEADGVLALAQVGEAFHWLAYGCVAWPAFIIV